MSQAKRTYITGTTPTGVFIWPKFTEADDYNKIGTKLRLSAEDYETLMDRVQEDFDAAVARAEEAFAALPKATLAKMAKKGITELTINPIGQPVFDEEGEETGEYDVNFTIKASGESKDTGEKWKAKPIKVFDAKGKPLTLAQARKVWGGSTGKVAYRYDQEGYFIPATAACGLSLKITGAQVITLRGPGSENAASLGFGVEEDGFSAEDLDDNSPEDFASPGAASTDDDTAAADF